MRSHLSIPATVMLIFCSSVLGCAQRTAPAKKTEDRIPFLYSSKDFGELKVEDIAAEKDPATGQPEMPFDAPAHRCYNFERKAELPALDKGPRYFYPAYSFICIVPTSDPSEKDFAKAYPNFSEAVELIKNLVRTKPAEFKQFDDLFDFPYNNAGWAFKTKSEYLTFPHISGVFFVTQYTQDMTPTPANNEELTANFQGITGDGKYYIAARFAITNPALPRGIDFTDDRIIEEALKGKTSDEIGIRVSRYLKQEEEKVSKLPDTSFSPSLPTLKKLLSSVAPK